MSITMITTRFSEEIARHTMTVIRDAGLYRHLRFRRPDTTCMQFDILTWPGHLCYTGDMGSYLFRRLNDMLELFRRGASRRPFEIDFSYCAEKAEAIDRCDGLRRWDAELFRREVRAYFEQWLEDSRDDISEDRKKALWQELEDEVLAQADEGEWSAMHALFTFESDGFYLRDFELNHESWSYRFMWCCHALEWAIEQYDAYSDAAKSAS